MLYWVVRGSSVGVWKRFGFPTLLVEVKPGKVGLHVAIIRWSRYSTAARHALSKGFSLWKFG
jgi:hypothetical protein